MYLDGTLYMPGRGGGSIRNLTPLVTGGLGGGGGVKWLGYKWTFHTRDDIGS